MPPVVRILAIAMLLAAAAFAIAYVYLSYKSKKDAREHEKEMLETKHRLEERERLLFDEEDDIDRELARERERR